MTRSASKATELHLNNETPVADPSLSAPPRAENPPPPSFSNSPIEASAYTIDKQRVRKSFHQAAHRYDQSAILQAEVRQRLFERLSITTLQPTRILDAGCGTGGGTQLLRQRYPQAQCLLLDFAEGMLQQARQRQQSLLGRVKAFLGQSSTFAIGGDLEHLPIADESVDLVWSNLAVQWCNDLDQTLQEIHRVLKPEGLIIFSTFGPDTLKELRASTAIDAEHVHVSRFIDMHDIGDAMVRAGFAAPVLDVEQFELTYDNVKAVMQDLKAIGAHNAAQGRHRGLHGRQFFTQLQQRYEAYRKNGKLPATYEVVYAHGWKAAKTASRLDDGVAPIHFKQRTP